MCRCCVLGAAPQMMTQWRIADCRRETVCGGVREGAEERALWPGAAAGPPGVESIAGEPVSAPVGVPRRRRTRACPGADGVCVVRGVGPCGSLPRFGR